MYTLPSSGSEVLRSYNIHGREITMTSLGNIALSLKDRVVGRVSSFYTPTSEGSRNIEAFLLCMF